MLVETAERRFKKLPQGEDRLWTAPRVAFIVFREHCDLRAETYITTGGNKQCHIIFTPRFEMKHKYVGRTSMLITGQHIQLYLVNLVSKLDDLHLLVQ
jgi:hypothetical protein